MKYFTLTSGKWQETDRQEGKREVNLYDLENGQMEFKGIGQY